MIYEYSGTAIGVFAFFVALVLAISFYLGARAKSAKGYFAAHGQINWFVNGIAFAGDYLSAASFLGICGLIAFYGFDGFLYSIGFLAGWVVALFVIAEPLKRLGRYTFADALDNRFNSRGIKLAAAISTLLVSLFYLIPQMVGAGALIRPLLGLPYEAGVVIVGIAVIVIVVTAGMVSTTWVQFIKGSLLVFFCAVLTIMILERGLTTDPDYGRDFQAEPVLPARQVLNAPGWHIMGEEAGWRGKPYIRMQNLATGEIAVWRKNASGDMLSATQTITKTKDGRKLIDYKPQGTKPGEHDLNPVGHIAALPPTVPQGQTSTGPLGPLSFIRTIQESTIVLWGSELVTEADGSTTTIYYQKPTPGTDVLTPGAYFKGLKSNKLSEKLDFISLMLALFAGTASLPHILIRYYTVKDQASARKSTVVGIASIGFFYILTLYLGLGAMVSGRLDVSDSNMAAPLLARTFGELPFAVISAIAFTTVLGTVSGLIMAASGAVAHDLMTNYLRIEMTDHQKVLAGKWAAIIVGAIAMGLGIAFQRMNVSFLVGWAFNVAASANLPALVMLLFWSRTTRQGITAAIVIGLLSSLAWLLLSGPAYKDVYGLDPARAPVPFSQPGLVTIPLGFVVLVLVSLMTGGVGATEAQRTQSVRVEG